MAGEPEPVPPPSSTPPESFSPAPTALGSTPPVGTLPAVASPDPRARRHRLLVVVGAVAVAAVLLAAVLALGLLGPGANSASTGPMGTPIDFDAAVARANSEALLAPGGPWTIVLAEGMAIGSGIAGANTAGLVGGGCDVTPAAGSPSVITLLGTPSNASPGNAAQWFFFSTNASDSSVLMMSVNASSAVPIDLGTGSSCMNTFNNLPPLNGSGVIDSVIAAHIFDSDGATAWAQNHTVVTRAFLLLGTSSNGGSFIWGMTDSTCNLVLASGSGLEYIQAIDASTGSAITSPSQMTVSC
jgi:hypothetical protein